MVYLLKMVIFQGKLLVITRGQFNIDMENGPFIDGLPIKNGDFPGQTVSHNQRVI